MTDIGSKSVYMPLELARSLLELPLSFDLMNLAKLACFFENKFFIDDTERM